MSKNPALETLGCSNNKLTSLDISKNKIIADVNHFYCAHNRIFDPVLLQSLVSKFGEALVLPQDVPAGYAIKFDADGGSVSPSYKALEKGVAYGALPVPVRAGYTFLGWYTAKVGGAQVGADTPATASRTIYARWEKIGGDTQQTSEPPVPIGNIPAAKTPVAPGKAAELPVSVTFTDGTKSDVKWTSGDSGVAKIGADGKLVAVGEGKVTLTATATDGSGKTQTITVTVAKPVTKIRTPIASISLKKGASLKPPVCADSVNAQGKADNKAKLTYKSSNDKVVTVDANGKIKAKKTGKATITISSLNGKTTKIKVNVVAKAKKLKKLALTKPPKNLKVGKSAQLKLKLTPASATNLNIKFKVSGKSVKIDAAGKITAVKKGKSKVTVTAGGKKIVITIRVK